MKDIKQYLTDKNILNKENNIKKHTKHELTDTETEIIQKQI